MQCLFETRGDELDIFVEPEADDEGKNPRPIVHIVVQSTSYIDGSRTDSGSAVALPGTCTCPILSAARPASLAEKCAGACRGLAVVYYPHISLTRGKGIQAQQSEGAAVASLQSSTWGFFRGDGRYLEPARLWWKAASAGRGTRGAFQGQRARFVPHTILFYGGERVDVRPVVLFAPDQERQVTEGAVDEGES